MSPHRDRDRPRFVVQKRNADGTYRRYWQPSKALAEAGWKVERLSDERGPAYARAVQINERLDEWYAAGKPPMTGDQAAVLPGSVAELVEAYRASRKFTKNAPKTQSDYGAHLDYIKTWIGKVPAQAVTERMIKTRYAALHKKAPRSALMFVSVGRIAWHTSRTEFDRGHPCHIPKDRNPWSALGLESSAPAGTPELWSRADLEDVNAASLRLAWGSVGTYCRLGWWLGQRQGDLLKLPRQLAETGSLVIRQGKRKRLVHLAADQVDELQVALADELARQEARGANPSTVLLLNERTNAQWQEDTFRHAFRDVCIEAAIGRVEIAAGQAYAGTDRIKLGRAIWRNTKRSDDRARKLLAGRARAMLASELVAEVTRLASLRAMWLRHTAITECAKAMLTDAQISAITGLSLQTIRQILDRHYLVRDAEMTEAAMRQRVTARSEVVVAMPRSKA